MKEKHQKLIGQTFGLLTIKNIVPYYRKPRPNQKNYRDYKAKVYCRGCSNYGFVKLRSVLEGTAKSCGCQKYKNRPRGLENKRCIDLRGRKYGKLTVLDIDLTPSKRVKWICKCDCGNQKSVQAKHLVNAQVTSCNCTHHRLGKEHHCWKGYEEISGKYWETLKRNARYRKMDFFIPIEYAWEIYQKQERKCALTGIPIKFKTKSELSDGTASLDRIDSSKGYIKNNIQWVDKRVNTIKWNLTLDNFFKICKMVVEYNKL